MKHLEKLNNAKPFLKVLLIGFIIILMQIPVAMLRGVIWEREGSRDSVVADVTSKWGHHQELMGPVMVVPYRVEVKPVYTEDEKKKGVVKESTYITREAMFLPETLNVVADVKSDELYRGIYEVPVYNSKIKLSGQYKERKFAGWDIEEKDILWHRATVNFFISDARALSSATDLTWGKDKLKLEPGSNFGTGTGIHAKLTKEQAKLATRGFAMDLSLKGSEHLYVAPMGSQTNIHITSDWPHPSFQGNWLPVERKVSKTDAPGFDAKWEVNLLGRNFPERWLGLRAHEESMSRSYMGVRFKVMVDEYSMALRSVKYDVLFMVMVFMTLWMFEVLSGIRIHAVQYVMVGAAMCMFYLLELSLAEHIGFLWAYCIASSMVCGLVAGYCKTVLQTGGRASIVGGVLSLLYAYLYMLLVNQGYALLAGSMGLFAVLAAVMYLTRNIDWSGESEAGPVTTV